MNKKILTALTLAITISLSFTAKSETFEKTTYLTNIAPEIINVDEAHDILYNSNKSLEELNKLGDFYIYNDKYRNTFKSFEFYQESAKRGSEYAKMMVGYMIFKGYGTPSNIYRGESILKDVRRPYDKNSLFLLGLLLHDKGAYDDSINIFKEIKDPLSYEYLVEMLIEQRRTEEAIPYLEWLIDNKNNRLAKRQLGELYLSKRHLNEDKAIELLTSAAEDGDDVAQYTLGMYYYKGTPNKIADLKEAARWFLISAQHDNAFAIQELLKLWNDNQTKDNLYKLSNDPYLTKQINDLFTELHLNN